MAKKGRKDRTAAHEGDVLGLSDADPHVKIPTPVYRDDGKHAANNAAPEPAGALPIKPEWSKPEGAEPDQADHKP